MKKSIKTSKKPNVALVKRRPSTSSRQETKDENSEQSHISSTNENKLDFSKRQLQVFKTPSIIVKRYRIEPKSTDSLSNITSDQNSTAPINERIFTPSHVFIKSNPFFKTKSTSLLSMQTVQTTDRLVFDHQTSIEKEKQSRHKKRRRRGGWFCTPWFCCCCCISTLLVLAAITALVLALTLRPPPNAQSNTPTTVTTEATSKSTITTTTLTLLNGFNQTCIADSNCDGTLLLTCQNSTCVCNGSTTGGNWFWSGSSCLLCPQQWMIFGTHCYYLSNTSKTWNNSRTYCKNNGADLMIIESLAEYNFITSVAQALMPTTNWVQAWIGLITLVPFSPGLFQWLDGTNITGLNPPNYIWCNLIRQMCCGLVHAMPPGWPTNYVCVDDNYCDDNQLFICEKSS